MAVVLGILMWNEKKESNAKAEELTKLNEQIFAENQAKAEALKQKDAEDSFYQKLSDEFDVNVLVVGDSIAENGQGEKGWCTLLQNNLRKTYGNSVSFTNVSMGGNASYAGYVRTMALNDDVNYDLAIICYGQNDSTDGFSTNYESIIRAIRSRYPDCSIISVLESSQKTYTEKMTTIQSICEHYSIPVAILSMPLTILAKPMMTCLMMVSTRTMPVRKSTLKRSNRSLMITWLLLRERCQMLM